MHELRFPVGEFKSTTHPDQQMINDWIKIISNFPNDLGQLVNDLDDTQLAKIYRPGGWTVRQVVHHCADSHLNAFMRFKLALTEKNPNIKPYEEALWAELPDTLEAPIELSLNLLDGLHARWAILLRSLNEKQLQKQFIHPEHGMTFSLVLTIDNYQWHCRHHLGHVKLALGIKAG